MTLAIFDLDNTLLAGDSDYLWGQFLVDKGAVDPVQYEQANNLFYEQYKQGSLDIMEFLEFSLRPLAQHDMHQLTQWHTEFMSTKIDNILLPRAIKLIEKHRQSGDTLMIITATNRFVTQGIANKLGIDNLLATEPEIKENQYTGKVSGTPCFQDGKVKRLKHWLKDHSCSLQDSWFYSDSHNDLPLLKLVTHPVAVDADEKLTDYATEQQWQCISLR
ncbi:Phosphoserine phosphatase [hydrothermal vent metagenome]|uniref:Phosphoserine phosphatase n=1 Tax=hydrothermal vent metagenome TaxID=652676 RepID=A0A3B0YN16_9ZZZZ